jgi:ribosome maturation factor RimP
LFFVSREQEFFVSREQDMSKSGNIASSFEAIAAPVAASLGLEIVQVLYLHEGGSWVVRILVDRPDGPTIADCRKLSRELSDVLDVEDPTPSAYRLEVSSPGLDRPLVRVADFERFAGKRISLSTSRPVGERRKFKGELIGIEHGQIVVEVDGTRFEIEHALIDKANLVPEIEGFPSKL